MSGVTNYPNASRDALKAQFVGRMLRDVDGPAAIIDVAVARRNCQLMLDAADALGVLFRAHVKTHKTTELTKLQVGEKNDPIRLVVSTLAEAEQLQPYLEECKANGRSTDLIYGLPVLPSCFKRLAALGKSLGKSSISVLTPSGSSSNSIPDTTEPASPRTPSNSKTSSQPSTPPSTMAMRGYLCAASTAI
ncbi:hypothetical protein EMPG_13709 [Blastomyces silverae]|uniref:Alanine racemase N-terminal domain-containing protein n=1 Tax=Blastomyces silverae TaxID=2060906 RepID=A0A0H1BI42_9EURO|nr:hypothetical protein EMPG_13709 [Blastomyces silverae]